MVQGRSDPTKKPVLLLSAKGLSTQAEPTKEPTGLFGLGRAAGLCSLAAISQVGRERERGGKSPEQHALHVVHGYQASHVFLNCQKNKRHATTSTHNFAYVMILRAEKGTLKLRCVIVQGHLQRRQIRMVRGCEKFLPAAA